MESSKCDRLANYLLGRTLGEGFSSQVRMARDAETGMAFAIKYMRRECTDMDLKGLAENEMKIMSALNHPNIISVKEFNEGVIEKVSGEKLPVIYIVLELAMGGEMFDYVAITQCFADEVARYYFHQLIDALQYLHGKGICHRDLKAENLLLNEIYKLKLADFGFSVALRGRDDSGFLHTYKGTEGYMAPEIEEGKPYQGEKVDIFAAGVILFILIAELPPFESAILKDQCYQKIYKGDYDSFWEFHKYLKENPDFYKPDFMNLINALLAKDPAKRPTLAEIMSHPWQDEEIQSEFQKRHKIMLSQTLKNEEEYREEMSDIVAKEGYRGLQGDEDKGAFDETESEEFKDIPHYNDGQKVKSQFFTHFKPTCVCTQLSQDVFENVEGFDELDIDDSCFSNEFKLNYLYKCSFGKSAGEIKFLKVDDETRCVQFLHQKGHSTIFRNFFKKFVKENPDLLNATDPSSLQ